MLGALDLNDSTEAVGAADGPKSGSAAGGIARAPTSTTYRRCVAVSAWPARRIASWTLIPLDARAVARARSSSPASSGARSAPARAVTRRLARRPWRERQGDARPLDGEGRELGGDHDPGPTLSEFRAARSGSAPRITANLEASEPLDASEFWRKDASYTRAPTPYEAGGRKFESSWARSSTPPRLTPPFSPCHGAALDPSTDEALMRLALAEAEAPARTATCPSAPSSSTPTAT